MAKKRMFSATIVEDDVFLDMPPTSQNLYFHLCMNADDDGFVSPKKVMRMCTATQDDLRLLIAKRYVLIFDSGVVVIKHWPAQNAIRKDRYIATSYQKELKQLTLNEWGVYTERRAAQASLLDVDNDTTDNRGQVEPKATNGNQMATQVRLGKVRLDNNKPTAREREEQWFDFWKQTTGIDQRRDNYYNRGALQKLLERFKPDELKQLIAIASAAQADKYAPKGTKVSDFYQLEMHADDVLVWGKGKVLTTAKKQIRRI